MSPKIIILTVSITVALHLNRLMTSVATRLRQLLGSHDASDASLIVSTIISSLLRACSGVVVFLRGINVMRGFIQVTGLAVDCLTAAVVFAGNSTKGSCGTTRGWVR